MKRICIILTVMLLFVSLTVQACKFESHYTRMAKVTKVQKELITVKDKTGNIWQFRGQGFKKRNKVKLVFDNNNTDKIEDDRIINAIRVD